MREKITVLVANQPEPVNGVTWWRMYRPLALLARQYPDLEIRWNRGGHLFPQDFFNVDVLLVFRPENAEHTAIIAEAKKWGCKIIIDMDDNTLNVPVGHPVYQNLLSKARNINEAIDMADQVWTSTEHLQQTLKQANGAFRSEIRRTMPALADVFGPIDWQVIPNAVLPSDLPDRANGNTRFAVWRGSNLHRDDLEAWRHEYDRLLRNSKFFQWVGYMPHWGQSDILAQGITYKMGVPVEDWFGYLRSLRPSIVWKPLVGNEFNRSKSNISWLEATCAGAICYTNFAGSHPMWEHCTRELPKLDESYILLWQKSAEAIRLNYNLAAWNEVRYREILKVVNG